MKRTFIFALAAVMLLAGCSVSAEAGTTPEAAAAEAVRAEVTTAAETAASTTAEIAPAETAAAETDVPDGELIRPYIADIFPGGSEKIVFGAAEADKEAAQDCLRFSCAYGYIASGKEYSDYEDPEFELWEGYSVCTPYYFGDPEIIPVREGDTFGGLTVKKAYSTVLENDNRLLDMHIDLEGEIDVTGTVGYYYDEEYMISSGNMYLGTLDGLEGVPLPVGAGSCLLDSDDAGTYHKTTVSLYIGNLLEMQENGETGEWAEALYDMFGSERENCSKRVKATLSNLRLEWSEQFGGMRCYADIVRIEAL